MMGQFGCSPVHVTEQAGTAAHGGPHADALRHVRVELRTKGRSMTAQSWPRLGLMRAAPDEATWWMLPLLAGYKHSRYSKIRRRDCTGRVRMRGRFQDESPRVKAACLRIQRVSQQHNIQVGA